MEHLGAQNWVLIGRDYSLGSQSTLYVWEAPVFQRPLCSPTCRRAEKRPDRLTPVGQVLEDVSDTSGRWLVSFHLRQVLHKNTSCLPEHARRVQPRACCLALVEKRRRASGSLPSDPDPTQPASPHLLPWAWWNRVTQIWMETIANISQHGLLRGKANERTYRASSRGSSADCKWLPLAQVNVVFVPMRGQGEDVDKEGEQ